jgi:ferric iron reductase protein FhuF
LARIALFGPYFAVSIPPVDGQDAGWRPFADWWAGAGPLDDEISVMARRLGTGETRVAASILFQGIAARIWSPVLAAVAAHDLLPDLAPDRLRWRPAAAGPLPLMIPRPTGWTVAADRRPDAIAGLIYQGVVTEILEPLSLAVRDLTPVAGGLLWGNAASALAGTVTVIDGRRPDLRPRLAGLMHELLGIGLLRGTGDLAGAAPDRPSFVRRSCCLYYRVPGGGMCGDCPLIPGRLAGPSTGPLKHRGTEP